MDTLTHGLLGAALVALPLPRRLERGGVLPLRAALTASVLAAQLPDLDYLLPAEDEVLHTLAAHRGLTHSLVAAPLVALAAALFSKLWFRAAPFEALYARALLSVPLAHLLPDLWTGWGTRLLLPFSERRLALDWTMVLDPWFTAPLSVAALWAFFRRRDFRRAMAWGGAFAATYLALRIGTSAHLTRQVARAYPQAESVHVFPTLLAVTRCRYVARLGLEWAAGSVALGSPPEEAARAPSLPTGPLPSELLRAPTVREALAWARFPVVSVEALDGAARRVRVADLRYHLQGKPTLTFVIDVQPDGGVRHARLDRGGSARDLLRRFREPRPE